MKLKEKVEEVEGVNEVIWIDDALDISVPKEILPESVRKILYSDNSTLMIIKFKGKQMQLKKHKKQLMR